MPRKQQLSFYSADISKKEILDTKNTRFCFRKRNKVEYCEESSGISEELVLSKKMSDSILKNKSTSKDSSHYSSSKFNKKSKHVDLNILTIKNQIESITCKVKRIKPGYDCINSSTVIDANILREDIDMLLMEKIQRDSEYFIDCIFVNFPWENHKFDDLISIKYPISLMKDTIIGLWVEKQYISRIIFYYEDVLKFKYIDNVVCCFLDKSIKEFITNKNNHKYNVKDTKIKDYLIKRQSEYFSNSKLKFLLFRRYDSNSNFDRLVINHQRNTDVIFVYDDKKPNDYIYDMFEDMIPKKDSKSNNSTFIELFYNGLNLRRNWVHIKQIDS